MQQSPGSMTSIVLPKITCFSMMDYFVMTISPFFTRQVHDTVATIAHFTSLFFIGYGLLKFYSVALIGLLVMQLVSFLFHLFYVYTYQINPNLLLANKVLPQNKLKWLEYGISATAGAVAVIYANDSPGGGYLAGLIFMSALQQYCGSIIDSKLYGAQNGEAPNFLYISLLITFASCLQVAEFIIVSYVGSPPFSVFLSYVIGWSLFGVHCVIHASVISQLELASDQQNFGPVSRFFLNRYGDRNWVESVYSCLGWAAKIAVFSTEYVYLKSNKLETAELHNVATGFGTVALVATLLTVVAKPGALPILEEYL